jgi:hypothetical protein
MGMRQNLFRAFFSENSFQGTLAGELLFAAKPEGIWIAGVFWRK